jgi:hypothetical protein
MKRYYNDDTVTVTAIVKQDRTEIDGTVVCRFNAPVYGKDIEFCVAVKDIASHTPKPRPIQVGDTVKDVGIVSHSRYIVVCIHGDYAWVKPIDSDKCFTTLLMTMEYVK